MAIDSGVRRIVPALKQTGGSRGCLRAARCPVVIIGAADAVTPEPVTSQASAQNTSSRPAAVEL